MILTPSSELYSDPELRERFSREWIYNLPLDKMLVAADLIVGHDDPVAFLDNLADNNRAAWQDAKQVITTLPAKTIFDNYGTDMLAWAAANATISNTVAEMDRGLAEYAGFDMNLFKKAKLWELHKASDSKRKSVIAQYRLMESLLGGGLTTVNLRDILTESALPGVTLSEKRLADYSLLPLCSEKESMHGAGAAEGWYNAETEQGATYNIWLDAPTGFALMYKGKPNAIAALAHSSPTELMIYQLQGVVAKRLNPTNEYVVAKIGARGLAPLDWQKVLVDVTTELAKNMGLEDVGIQAGAKNNWTIARKINDTEPFLSKQAAEKAYDVPAERLGFTKREDGDWHRFVD